VRITSVGVKKVKESREGEWFEVLVRERDGQWAPSPDHPPLLEEELRTLLRAWRLSHERVSNLLTLARMHFEGLLAPGGPDRRSLSGA